MWDFTLADGSKLRVHRGSGHQSQLINSQSGEFLKSVYVFEATQTLPSGRTKETFVLRSWLRHLRKAAHAASED